MAIRVFTTARLGNDLTAAQIKEIASEFRQLKEKKAKPAMFGRDATFNRPSSVVFAGVKHVHVHPNFLTGQPINGFSNLLRTWNLKATQMQQTSDTWLIYCQGSHNPDNYLLIAFWKDKAHDMAKSTTRMAILAEEAERFRKDH